ncbi:MAG: class II aldolase/adducin family protein [Bacteroidota bacterium]|nr:class II aldolase/adducin family protein [Bacteroidota bacterium]MDP4189918.1 class II aldolase/adducin family protein [Bacteroidota bacterium]MDP4194525.1 class II aldolase/adducin family protein [Bacteroidota bacterium]
MKQNITSLIKDILEACKRTYDRGYVASNDGNISARIDSKSVLITPTGMSKGFLKASDLIIVDMDGKLIKGSKKPSSETFMHLQIYKSRPDVNSVCHSHPPYATGFAVAGIPLNKMVLPEVIIALGTVPLVKYGTTGTDELYGSIAEYIKDFDAFLLANHGALTVGNSVINAYHKMETLEHAAKIQFIAKQLGQVKTLNKKQTDQLINLRQKFGVRLDLGLKKTKLSNGGK